MSRTRVVIGHRHRLKTAVDNRLFGIGRQQIADLRTVFRHAETVDPVLPNGLPGGVIIRIALKIIHDQIIRYDKAPDVAFHLGPIRLDLTDLPVIGGRIEKPCVIHRGSFGRTDKQQLILAGSEIHVVGRSSFTRLPNQKDRDLLIQYRAGNRLWRVCYTLVRPHFELDVGLVENPGEELNFIKLTCEEALAVGIIM